MTQRFLYAAMFAFALSSLATPARAEEADKAAPAKKGAEKKSKKGDKKEEEAKPKKDSGW